jgi:hypothetical protein
MPNFSRNAFGEPSSTKHKKPAGKKIAKDKAKKMKSIHSSNRKPLERDGGMNDSEHELAAMRQQMALQTVDGDDMEELEHRESDEGINDDNPDFNHNEFMFKKRPVPGF